MTMSEAIANRSGRSIRWLSASQSCTLVAGNMGVTTMGWWAANQGGIVDLSLWTSSYLFFTLLLGPVLSPLGDRYTRINLYGIALLFGALYYTVWGLGLFASGYGRPLLVVLSLINACTMSIVGPIRMAIFVDATGNRNAQKVMASQRLIDNIGRCLGPLLAGLLCSMFSYRYAYFCQLSFFMMASLLYAYSRPAFSNHLASSDRQSRGIRGWISDIAFGFRIRLASSGQRTVTSLTFFYLGAVSSAIAIMLPQVIVFGAFPGTLLGMATAASFLGGLLAGTALLSDRLFSHSSIAPGTIMLSGVGLAGLLLFSGRMTIPLSTFLLGCCTEVFMQKIGFRMVLSFPTHQRARLTASGQFLSMGSIALWCWALVPVFHRFGMHGVAYLLLGSCALSLLLVFNPAITGFLSCPDHKLEGFWGNK